MLPNGEYKWVALDNRALVGICIRGSTSLLACISVGVVLSKFGSSCRTKYTQTEKISCKVGGSVPYMGRRGRQD